MKNKYKVCLSLWYLHKGLGGGLKGKLCADKYSPASLEFFPKKTFDKLAVA